MASIKTITRAIIVDLLLKAEDRGDVVSAVLTLAQSVYAE